jgi:uncharacterized protein YdeI (YjbR/CyaY-like superfamily)
MLESQKETTLLIFSKANQQILDLSQGESLKVIPQKDTSKYQTPMTEELKAVLLSDCEAYKIFEKLLPKKQKNIIFITQKTPKER